MPNGYILEIKTSSTGVPNIGIDNEHLKQDEDTELEERIKRNFQISKRYKNTNKNKLKNMNMNRNPIQVDKYIKFTVKMSNLGNDEGFLINAMFKCFIIFLSVGLFWHVLNQVDAVGKLGKSSLIRLKILEDNDNQKRLIEILRIIYLSISVYVVNEIYWRTNYNIEESLIIIRDVGVQLESVLVTENIIEVFKRVLLRVLCMGDIGRSGKRNRGNRMVMKQEFVPMDRVINIVINEGFCGLRVVTYMVVVVKSENGSELLVAFENLMPRVSILQTLYRKSREFL